LDIDFFCTSEGINNTLTDAKLEATNGSMKDVKRPSFELRTSPISKKERTYINGSIC